MVIYNATTKNIRLTRANPNGILFRKLIANGYEVIGIASGYDMYIRKLEEDYPYDGLIVDTMNKITTNNKNNGQDNVQNNKK